MKQYLYVSTFCWGIWKIEKAALKYNDKNRGNKWRNEMHSRYDFLRRDSKTLSKVEVLLLSASEKKKWQKCLSFRHFRRFLGKFLSVIRCLIYIPKEGNPKMMVAVLHKVCLNDKEYWHFFFCRIWLEINFFSNSKKKKYARFWCLKWKRERHVFSSA